MAFRQRESTTIRALHVSRFFQLVPIHFGRQNEGHETSAEWECKAHPPKSCFDAMDRSTLTDWWKIHRPFWCAQNAVFHPRLVPRMTLPSYAAAFRYRKCWQLAFFLKEPCSDVLWKLYEVVLCAQGEKIDFTYSADGSCPLRIYLAWHFWTVLNLQMVLVVYEPSASYAERYFQNRFKKQFTGTSAIFEENLKVKIQTQSFL